MCFLPKSTSVSRRRRRLFQLRPPAVPLAVLDRSKLGEREAQDVVPRPQDAAAPYKLAEVSLTEPALCWRSYPSADAARGEMDQRCTRAPGAGETL